jgi:hypothetical protein
MPDTSWYTDEFPDVCEDVETRIKLIAVIAERFEAVYEPKMIESLRHLECRKLIYEDLTTGDGYSKLITLGLFVDRPQIQSFALSASVALTNYLASKCLKPENS